jgi:prepilin-type N-terminal cleavage/methylation domain-containing protein
MFQATSPRRNEGFSLLELMIVMGILAILALAIAPWFAKISQRNQVRSASQEVALSLQAARMRAVKRNLPASVVITPPTGPNQYNRIETFENVVPTPIKVGEVRLTHLITFPSGAGEYYSQPTIPITVTFGPDGRLQTPAPGATTQHVTIRGVIGAPVTNDLPIRIGAAGTIRVLKPNPDASNLDGTVWH